MGSVGSASFRRSASKEMFKCVSTPTKLTPVFGAPGPQTSSDETNLEILNWDFVCFQLLFAFRLSGPNSACREQANMKLECD